MTDIEDSAATVVARRVLLTGGTSGLGLAMASALAQAGATVVLTGRDAARAGQGAPTRAGAAWVLPGGAAARPERVAAAVPGASGLGLDTRDETSVQAAVRAAADRLG